MKYEPWMANTVPVLIAVLEERVQQERRYGHVNDKLEWGTGPHTQWLRPYTDEPASAIERLLREEYMAQPGLPTWAFLVREEIAEAFLEADPARLEAELVQVAALCVSWVERIRNGRPTT